jgi:hydroxyacylglutathione hydrolase
MSSVQVERFYLGCLAHASYLIGSEGVAAVIDPQRDVDLYIEAAARAGLKIEHVIETHLHADFVSGHHELAGRTGARIYLGDGSVGAFPHVAVKDCDSLQFGSCHLEFLQTPGHKLLRMCACPVRSGTLGGRRGPADRSRGTVTTIPNQNEMRETVK